LDISILGAQLDQLSISDEIKRKLHHVHTPRLDAAKYSEYDIVVGSGRVCMESLITGTATIAFGEAYYCGGIDEQNFESAFASNFGDIHPELEHPNLDESQFLRDLTVMVHKIKTGNESLSGLSGMASKRFSIQLVSRQVLRIYESAYFLKNYSYWIPVLMYHKIPAIAPVSRHKIYVVAAHFENHLKTFKRLGFSTVTLSELALYRKGELSFSNFPKKPLLLTFDDGYRDNLEIASPLLKKYGYRAQLFLLADKEISSNVWDQTNEEPSHAIISGNERQNWKESAFEIGSHGFSHQRITEFKNETMALAELVNSKAALEREFSTPVISYAFTYGTTSDSAAKLAQEAGYDYAFNTDTGGHLLEEEPYSIFRVNIFPDESFWSLFKKTSSWYRRYYYFKRKK
jgi:peptidoglycan/xylan/chitin deacetylase (PgdA/CDA1 family)